MEREERARYRRKEHGDIYERTVESAKRELNGNVRKRFKHPFYEEITVEEDGLVGEESRNVVMEMSKSGINVSTLPSVKRAFVSAEWR